MKANALIGLLLAAALVGALIYSQQRQGPLKASGFIEADEIRLGSRVGGRVAEILAEEGQRVAAGDVLVRLEPFEILHRLAEAQANLAAREAELARLEAGLRPQEVAQAKSRVDRLSAVLAQLRAGPLPEEIAAGRSRLALATAQYDHAKTVFDRTQALFRTNAAAVTKDEMDAATENYKVGQASVQVRREELALLERGTRQEELAAAAAQLDEAQHAYQLAQDGFRKEEQDAARALVGAARAAVAAVQSQATELEIRAGVAGVVDALQLRPGDLVAPNSPVLSLIDSQRMWIRAYVPENRLDLELGKKYRVTVDSFPDQAFPAELTYISTSAEFTPRNVQTVDERSRQVFRVKLFLKAGLDKLHVGMAADVWLDQPWLERTEGASPMPSTLDPK